MAENVAATGAFEAVAPYYDELMSGVPYRFWVRYLHQVWDRFGVRPRTILEIACGTGTVALQLAEQGYEVTGVDRSEPMLVEARKKASKRNLKVDFLCQDAAELMLPDRRFDCAICLFDSLNNILEPGRVQAAFHGAFAHLAEGGLFVFDVNTEYAFLEGLFNQNSYPADGGLQYDWRASYDEDARLCTITMDFSYAPAPGAEPHLFREVHVQRAYGKDELAGMLRAAGFWPISIFDAYSFSAPRRRSDRIFYIATKRASS